MKELTAKQVEEVSGGVVPIIVAAVYSATGSSTASLFAGVATHLAFRASAVYGLYSYLGGRK